MLAKEIRHFIQEPVLAAAGWSDPASQLLIYATGHIETGYQAVMQNGTPKNGGVGFYQEQPDDYAEILQWFKNGFAKPLLGRVLNACNYVSLPTDVMHVAYNVAYATLICRTHYARIKEPLPPLGTADTARLYAEYHYRFYNGNGEGKTSVERNIQLIDRILNNEIERERNCYDISYWRNYVG